MGPLAPDPIALLSREFIGTTSAAVPEKKDSSACKTSSIVRFFSSKIIPNSFASEIIVLLVMPSKQASNLG